jgi:hypothetical protein
MSTKTVIDSGPVVKGQHIFATAPTDSNSPDSITIGGGSIWVEYGNGASSTGAGGSSTIVQYSDAATGNVWVLLNNDGNSALQFINPATSRSATRCNTVRAMCMARIPAAASMTWCSTAIECF